MSNQFTIEMPKTGPSPLEWFIIGFSTVTTIGVSVLCLSQFVSAADTPAWFAAAVVGLAAAIIIFSLALFHLTVRSNRFRLAAISLSSGLERLGYTSLEPIRVDHKRFKMLLRDSHGAALWNVSLKGRKAIFQKSGAEVPTSV
jgi:hypothetical protein